jgi:hypothetical protein
VNKRQGLVHGPCLNSNAATGDHHMTDAGRHPHANLTVQLLAICMEGSNIVSADSIGSFKLPDDYVNNVVISSRHIVDFLQNVRTSIQFAKVVEDEEQAEEQHNGETAGSVGV